MGERALTGRDLQRSAVARYMIWFDDVRLFPAGASTGLTELDTSRNIKAFINSAAARAPRITSALVSNISMGPGTSYPKKLGLHTIP